MPGLDGFLVDSTGYEPRRMVSWLAMVGLALKSRLTQIDALPPLERNEMRTGEIERFAVMSLFGARPL